MDTAPGAAVMEGAVPIRYEAVPFVADKSFPMLQYVEQKRTQRTGFNSVGQGLDRDVLNKSNQMTATQASQQENKQNSRAEMIARIFAETGVKRLMKLVLKMLVKHQPKARVIRLRNEWIEVDPRGWNPEMDLKINVGLGIGNKMEQLAQAESVLVTMAELGQTEYADLLSKKTVYNAVKRKFQAAGIKNIDDFLSSLRMILTRRLASRFKSSSRPILNCSRRRPKCRCSRPRSRASSNWLRQSFRSRRKTPTRRQNWRGRRRRSRPNWQAKGLVLKRVWLSKS